MDSGQSQIDDSEHGAPIILIAGEALMDMIPREDDPTTYSAIPGGSPFNVAIGLSRLNIATGFLGKLSTDPLGQRLKSVLRDNGVCLGYVQDDSGPTQLALVTQQVGNEPQYVFYGHQSADGNLRPEDLPAHLPKAIRALHFGSLSLISQPVGATLTQLMRRESPHRIISLDPNVRPARIPDLAAYMRQLEDWVRLSHIVKLSQADLEVLYPGAQAEEIAHRWLTMGPLLIVITQGDKGATGYTVETSAHVPAPPIHLVDAIGAGDAFTSGMLAWLHDQEALSGPSLSQLGSHRLRHLLQFAAQVAAVTCERAGANPPCRSELAR